MYIHVYFTIEQYDYEIKDLHALKFQDSNRVVW